MQAAYDHCAALVRERDRERFLATLFAPSDRRPHLFALFAFVLEIAHVPDAVREPMAGEIRFQWWREALAGERIDEAKANPVAAAVLDTITQHTLPVEDLVELIDAHQFDLLGQPMESREALDKYLGATAGKPIELASRILDSGWNAAAATGHAGRTIGIAGIFRNFARDISKGRLFVPLDLLAANEVHTASVFGGESSIGLRAALMELRESAAKEFNELRATRIPAPVLPAFLPAVLTPLYLAKIDKAGYDPFRSNLSVFAIRSQFALWRAARSGKI